MGESAPRTESLREENLPLRGSPRRPPKPPGGTLVMTIKSQKGTSQRFSKVLSETLGEDFSPRSVAP